MKKFHILLISLLVLICSLLVYTQQSGASILSYLGWGNSNGSHSGSRISHTTGDKVSANRESQRRGASRTVTSLVGMISGMKELELTQEDREEGITGKQRSLSSDEIRESVSQLTNEEIHALLLHKKHDVTELFEDLHFEDVEEFGRRHLGILFAELMSRDLEGSVSWMNEVYSPQEAQSILALGLSYQIFLPKMEALDMAKKRLDVSQIRHIIDYYISYESINDHVFNNEEILSIFELAEADKEREFLHFNVTYSEDFEFEDFAERLYQISLRKSSNDDSRNINYISNLYIEWAKRDVHAAFDSFYEKKNQNENFAIRGFSDIARGYLSAYDIEETSAWAAKVVDEKQLSKREYWSFLSLLDRNYEDVPDTIQIREKVVSQSATPHLTRSEMIWTNMSAGLKNERIAKIVGENMEKHFSLEEFMEYTENLAKQESPIVMRYPKKVIAISREMGATPEQVTSLRQALKRKKDENDL